MKAYEKFAAGLILGTSLATQALAESKYSDWKPPVNLGCAVNSAFTDDGPAISKDGLSLYFGSIRPGGVGAVPSLDIWVSQRASVDALWEPPVNLGEKINTEGIENVPALSRDGHWLFFNSNRAGGVDIWVSWRENVHDDFGWQTPVKLGAGVNSALFDAGASYFENEEGRAPLLFFGRGPAINATDIYVSELQPDGSFSAAVLIRELSSEQNDSRPSVRFDGLELFLFSNRPGSFGGLDLWVSTRETVFDAWETPTNLGPTVNSDAADQQPYIAADRLTLFFSSDRPGGCGGTDLYMTTRTKHEDGDKAN